MFCCKILEPEIIIYILSLAFQVAGAVLLIIRYWGRTKERIIDEYFPGSNVVTHDGKGNVPLKKDKVQKCAQTVYDNRVAFVFIAVGYIMSIFGSVSNVCKICVVAFVISSTVIIILIEKCATIALSKRLYKKDIIVCRKEIEHVADVNSPQSEVDAEIDSWFL